MWGRIKQLIIASRHNNTDMESMIVDDVVRGIKMVSSGTAVGMDQWSPSHWKQLSPKALEAITHLFNDIETHGVWPAHI